MIRRAEGELMITHLPDVNATAPWAAETRAHIALQQAQHNGQAHGHAHGHGHPCAPLPTGHSPALAPLDEWRWPIATPSPRRFTAPSMPRLRVPVATAAASVQLPAAGSESESESPHVNGVHQSGAHQSDAHPEPRPPVARVTPMRTSERCPSERRPSPVAAASSVSLGSSSSAAPSSPSSLAAVADGASVAEESSVLNESVNVAASDCRRPSGTKVGSSGWTLRCDALLTRFIDRAVYSGLR
jgi:hypothetical protein